MPSSRSCRRRAAPSAARGDPVPAVRTPEEALDAVLLTTDVERPGMVALLLGEGRRGVTAVVIDGAPDDVDHVAELLLEAVAWSEVVALVLATARPGGSPLPTDDDRLAWARVRQRCDDAGVELLDWFVLAQGRATSLAEHTGTSRW